jgi:YD repeat-containing protein
MKYTFQTTNFQGFVIYHITEMTDASGDKLTFNYDTHGRLSTIVDADGGTTIISYWSNIAGSNAYVYRVTTPDGRYAEFNYDTNDGKLNSIRDAQGITSSFDYNPSTLAITSLTTPYGTTTFDYNPANAGLDRWIKVTTPGNKVHAYCYIDESAPGVTSSWSANSVPTIPASVLSEPNYSTTGRDDRLSIHWDPKQWSSLSQTDFSAMTYNEFKKGRMTHWLSMGSHLFHAKNAVQEPSHNGSSDGRVTFYDYQGKSIMSYIEPVPIDEKPTHQRVLFC